MTLYEKSELAAQIVQTACKIFAPKDTGNLAINAIRCVYEDGLWQVVIGGELAPYAIYTNEPWINRGGKNPNEGWIERAIESVKPVLIGIFQDKYTLEEIQTYTNKLDVLSNILIKDRMRGVINFDI